jgi:hypothetical protein
VGAPSILLGAILSFGASDGETLQLTVSLARSATCALTWDGVARSSTASASRHVFRGLARPHGKPIDYMLAIAGEPPLPVRVTALADPKPDRMKIALYGDTREGDGPHRRLIAQMVETGVDVVIHTGDFGLHANDEAGWIDHLASTLPVAERTPHILALGNHELYAPQGTDALSRALEKFPPPADPEAENDGAPRSAFHVRIGPVLIVSLDSNQTLAKGSAQYRFLDDVLAKKSDARFVFVALHHGVRSSGPHGPHPDSDDVAELFERYGITASLSGHDHTYERIVRNGISYIVSGGGGAPLYQRGRFEPGSQAFASTYNWVLITIDGDHADMEAYSLEGAVLDSAPLAPRDRVEAASVQARSDPRVVLGAAALLACAFVWAATRLARRGT